MVPDIITVSDVIINQSVSGGGSDKTFVYHQIAAAQSATIIHNLNKYPAVEFMDSGLNRFMADVVYIDLNTIYVSINSPAMSFSVTLN